MIGALTIGVIGRHGSPLTNEVDIAAVADVGSDILFGTARLKVATALRMVASTISSGVMIRLGRVYSNFAVERSQPGDRGLDMAIRMVELTAGVERPVAAAELERADGNLKVAIVAARLGLDPETAQRALDEAGGDLRETLERESAKRSTR